MFFVRFLEHYSWVFASFDCSNWKNNDYARDLPLVILSLILCDGYVGEDSDWQVVGDGLILTWLSSIVHVILLG